MKAVVVCHDCLKKLHDGYNVRTSDLKLGKCECCKKKSMVVTATITKKE